MSSEELNTTFIFERVELIIEEHGIRQEDIQEYTSMYQSTISRCLSDKTVGKTFFKIVMMLFEKIHLNPSWLFLYDNSKQTKYISHKNRT